LDLIEVTIVSDAGLSEIDKQSLCNCQGEGSGAAQFPSRKEMEKELHYIYLGKTK
jgi:hypothetical protein